MGLCLPFLHFPCTFSLPFNEVRNIFPSMSVPREYYFDGCDDGFLDDRGGNMINPRVGHPLYLQAGA